MDQIDTLNIFIQNIKNGTPFVFTKMGDGELACMDGYSGYNCDGTEYTEELRSGLINAFKFLAESGAYIAPWSMDLVKKWEETWSRPTNWVDGNILLHSDRAPLDKTIEFWKTVRDYARPKVFVGGPHLKKVKEILRFDLMYCTDPVNSYGNINDALNYIPKDGILVTSCGMAAKILISEAIKKSPKLTAIDAGSAFDALCGRPSRTGQILNRTIEELYDR